MNLKQHNAKHEEDIRRRWHEYRSNSSVSISIHHLFEKFVERLEQEIGGLANRVHMCRECYVLGLDYEIAEEHTLWIEYNNQIGGTFCSACIRDMESYLRIRNAYASVQQPVAFDNVTGGRLPNSSQVQILQAPW
jgi:hypothetical protein